MSLRTTSVPRFRLHRLAVCVALALPGLAQAQSEAPAVAQDGTPVPQVEVAGRKSSDTEGSGSYTARSTRTATPITMSLRDTPQSVSVVTQQRIEDQNLVSVADVVNNATGVSVNQYETNRAGFTARGFDIDNLQIDGIPTTWDQSWSAGEITGSLAMYDRVEIVRGATGLMTGAGNPSAAINLVRKRATSRELTGTAEVGIGSWNEKRGLIDVSTPLNAAGTIRGRVVGEYEKGDSWVDFGANKSQTIYATVEADLTPSTLLSAGFGNQETEAKSPMWGGLPYWYTDGTKTNWDTSKTTSATWSHWPTRYNTAFVNLDHSFDNGWKLRATASHGDRDADSYLLYLSGVPDRVTGLGMSAFSASYQTETKQNDFGLHLSGPFELLGRKHEAAFGYMHMKQEFTSNSRAADYGTQDSSVGNFNTWNPATYATPTWGPTAFYERSTTRQEGLYGMVRLTLANPLKLILGARTTNYEKTGVGVYTTAYDIKHDNEITPYAGLVYAINDTYSAYASYTDIFQPQNLKDINGNFLDPIKGKSYEGGVKAEYFGGKVNASAAVFQIRQDKLGQAAGTIVRDATLGRETYYSASEGAKSEGFEFEVGGQLAPGWNATAGYTQFRVKDATGADVNSIYPRRLLRVFTTYQLPGDWNKLTVGGGVNYEGRTYTVDPAAPSNTNGLIEQDGFAMVNLMARYEISQNLSAQVNVTNAFDKTHFGMFAAYGAITYGTPRAVSAMLKYKF